MPRPKISVIIPCYNQAHYLPEALASVLAQTHQDWECIIVNDGSPDHTAEVAKEWMERDPRFRYVEKPNGGLSSARNRGLEEARGDYIQFLDADDAIHPRKFEFQVAAVLKEQGQVVVTSDYYFSEPADLHAELPGERMSPELDLAQPLKDLALRWETRLSIPCHCFLFDARLFSETGIRFDESLPNHEDWDCWMRLFTLGPIVRHVPEKLAIYRFHSSSMSRDRRRMRHGFLAAIRKQQGLLKDQPGMVRILRMKQKEIHLAYADCAPMAGCRAALREWKARFRAVLVKLVRMLLPVSCINRLRQATRHGGID